MWVSTCKSGIIICGNELTPTDFFKEETRKYDFISLYAFLVSFFCKLV